jgi:hypothetical protein
MYFHLFKSNEFYRPCFQFLNSISSFVLEVKYFVILTFKEHRCFNSVHVLHFVNGFRMNLTL